MALFPTPSVSAVRSLLTAFSLLAGSTLLATTVAEDAFTDGILDGGSDPNDLAWFAASAATATIATDAAGLNSGNALQLTGTGNFSRVTAAFAAPITLSSAGNRMTVSARVRLTRFSEANEGGLRFGLHQNNGAAISAANAGESWTINTEGWDGYYFRAGVGGPTGMRIFRDLNNAGNSAMGGSGDQTIGNGTAWTLNDNNVHTLRIEVERQVDDQNTLRFYWDDELRQEASTSTAGGATTAFTNFTIGSGATELDLLVDDVVVTLTSEDTGGGNPPEPIDLSNRLIDWSQAGLQNGVPSYSRVIDFLGAGGDNTGNTDNAPLLQSLIDALTEDTVITFPAGTYRIDDRINFRQSIDERLPGIIIRGAGTDLTKLRFTDDTAEDEGLFDISGVNFGSDKTITGGLTKGSTVITLSSLSSIRVGDWLWLRQDNDPVAMATNISIPGYEETIDNTSGWARRVVGQVVQVAALTGDGVELVQPLHLDFDWPNPTATLMRTASGIGFEDFTLENAGGAADRFNFDFVRSTNCWIRNVHSLLAMRSHVAVVGSANLEIRDSYFNDAYRHDGGGHGYGVLLMDTTTHTLVENNVFRNLRHSMIWKEGANGNVFAYNYSTDGNQEGATVAKDVSGHGHYAFANLIEGNIVQFIHASDYWGPIGPNNMFLRNRATDERILITDGTKDQNIIGNELASPTSPFVVTDSTSTGAYVHGNNEGGTLQWRSGEAQSVVASYHYASQPEFWDISAPWPSLGPERELGAFTIPAKHRWDSGQMREFTSSAGDGRLSNLSTRGLVGSGDAILIAGFVITGPRNQQLLLRGIGPALDDFLNPADTLDDPVLTIYRGSDAILTNDDWGSQTDPTSVASTAATVGAFPLNETSADAALVADLPPGPYSMHLEGKTNEGIGLAEIYVVGSDDAVQLLNISTRGRVGTGDAILGPGIVVTESNRRLLIRGIGPELERSFGLPAGSTLPDPVLTLKNADGDTIATNDDWETQTNGSAAEIAGVAQDVGAFALSAGGRDAVLLINLEPGIYTAQVADSTAGEGIAIVEVYAVTN